MRGRPAYSRPTLGGSVGVILLAVVVVVEAVGQGYVADDRDDAFSRKWCRFIFSARKKN